MKKADVPTYLRLLADHMNLRDWSFIVSEEPPQAGRNAEVRPVFARKLAEVRLCPEFVKLDVSVQRHALVHELSHCHLEPAIAPLRATLRKQALSIYEYNIETVTDTIADLLAPTLPLPAS